MDLTVLSAVLSIILIDLVLSGDNALVIALAVRRLPARQQRIAAVIGAGGAIALRIFFTAIAALLLAVPLLQAIGGLVLVWIALRLLTQGEGEHNVREAATLRAAAWTIIAADVVMSLDNMLAVGAAAHGNLWLLLFGLGLSMPIMLIGAGLVAALMNRFPWLVPVGAAVLALTAGNMIGEDAFLRTHIPTLASMAMILPLFSVVAVMAVAAARTGASRPLRHYGIAVGCAVVIAGGSALIGGVH